MDDTYSIFNLTMWVPGTVANNGTEIRCVTMGDTTYSSDPVKVIVLGESVTFVLHF